jgi:hypothetical protein
MKVSFSVIVLERGVIAKQFDNRQDKPNLRPGFVLYIEDCFFINTAAGQKLLKQSQIQSPFSDMVAQSF